MKVIEFLSSHSGVITTILTTIGLVVVIIQLRENRRATQVQVSDSVFKKMNEILDRYYDTNPKIESKIESEEGMRWLSRYFNTMEYMAALVNLKLVHKKTFVRLYGEAILIGYERIFLERATQEEKDDPKIYSELKQLYNRLKTAKARHRKWHRPTFLRFG